VTAGFGAQLVEAVGQVLEVCRSVSARRDVPRLTASGFGRYRYARQRPRSYGVDDVDREGAGVRETGRHEEEQRQATTMTEETSYATTEHVLSTCRWA